MAKNRIEDSDIFVAYQFVDDIRLISFPLQYPNHDDDNTLFLRYPAPRRLHIASETGTTRLELVTDDRSRRQRRVMRMMTMMAEA